MSLESPIRVTQEINRCRTLINMVTKRRFSQSTGIFPSDYLAVLLPFRGLYALDLVGFWIASYILILFKLLCYIFFTILDNQERTSQIRG